MTVCRLGPVFWSFYQAAPDRVAMHVPEFFNCLLFVPHVEVIIVSLPEPNFAGFLQLPRCFLLQHLQSNRQGHNARLSDEHMNMLGHQHVSRNYKSELRARSLKLVLEDTVSVVVA